MNHTDTRDPKAACEGVLQEIRRRNVEARIAFREVRLIDQLLARDTEMLDVYVDVHRRLSARPQALALFFQLALDARMEWNPEKLQQARDSRDLLARVNQEIADAAGELAALLRQREHLQNTSSHGTDTHYHVCRVIEDAASGNYLFSSRVKERFDTLYDFGLAYWPSLSDFVDVLARDASGAVVLANDTATLVGTSGQRASRAHFVYALLQIMADNAARPLCALPSDFSLTDESWASLVNCLLGLGPEDSVDAAYIKGTRKRMRDGLAERTPPQ